MRRRYYSLMICFLTLLLMVGCYVEEGYTPAGEFYVKTAPSRGDTGISYVVSAEAERMEYPATGDAVVPMTVGFGHLPGLPGYGDDIHDTFYVRYRVVEVPCPEGEEQAWEKIVTYSDSWYDAKYNSTEQKNPPSLIVARYGQFYPRYKETVEILFPADLKKGYVEVSIFIMNGEEIMSNFGFLRFDFERKDGVLILDPNT